ncbi:MAG: hypothetical protein CL685_01600 [Candidatus Magasanikbacteria bacterium]|nr:hypothetical protein [Candidatus Magasanikbacteria bacterium]|tara:strand:+ start:4564 stop:5628 length:1065 start_codon:yes stop_codon:yes gene_type:complete
MKKEQIMHFNNLRSITFFLLIGVLGVLTISLLQPFSYPILWAIVVAILFNGVYKKIDSHIKIPNLSASVTVIIVIVTLFLPLMLLSTLLVHESAQIFQKISEGNYLDKLGNIATQIEGTSYEPIATALKDNWSEYAASGAQSISVLVFKQIKSITENSVRFTFMAFIMLYTLFYFLKDGKRILHKIMRLSPIGDTYEKTLYSRFTSTARATLKGTLIIGGIQGFLGWILFVITGIDGAFVWGVIMTILSIIPAIGSFLVWLPIGVIMLLAGNIWQGVTILLVGSILIGNIDNVLRPPLIGKDIQMHPLLVLFSTLGGIVAFGISGFVIGPIIVALFLAIIAIYSEYYKEHLNHN